MMEFGDRPVLVVDDDADIVETLALVLEQVGYSAIIAHDGQEAIDLLRSGARPSLILLDLMMPQMNGWEFRAEQVGDPDLAAIPVVVLTGDGHAHEKADALGVAGYLQKPVSLDAILQTVQRYRGDLLQPPTKLHD